MPGARPWQRRHRPGRDDSGRYEILLGPVSVTLPTGSRLQLEVTSSDFPRLARALGTHEDRYRGTACAPAQQTVLTRPVDGTRLILPTPGDHTPDHDLTEGESPWRTALLDARTGLITRLEPQRRRPGLPRMWVGYGAGVARTDVFAPWLADRFGFGAAAGDRAGPGGPPSGRRGGMRRRHRAVSARRAARADTGDAALKAYGEALQLQLFTADYDDPDGPYMRAAADPRSPLKPSRRDRDYADAYRNDLRDVVDYGCHLQLYLDPRTQDAFEAELRIALTEGPRPGPDPLAPADGTDPLEAVVGGIVAGHHPVLVDVTTPDVRAAGLHVVRALVPGLYSNTAAGLPFLGGTRLAESLAGAPRRSLPLPH
ncbi:hypothetical protein SALBM311S_01325 [Streptomyces alboniger]